MYLPLIICNKQRNYLCILWKVIIIQRDNAICIVSGLILDSIAVYPIHIAVTDLDSIQVANKL